MGCGSSVVADDPYKVSNAALVKGGQEHAPDTAAAYAPPPEGTIANTPPPDEASADVPPPDETLEPSATEANVRSDANCCQPDALANQPRATDPEPASTQEVLASMQEVNAECEALLGKYEGFGKMWVESGGMDASKLPKLLTMLDGKKVMVFGEDDEGNMEGGDIMRAAGTVFPLHQADPVYCGELLAGVNAILAKFLEEEGAAEGVSIQAEEVKEAGGGIDQAEDDRPSRVNAKTSTGSYKVFAQPASAIHVTIFANTFVEESDDTLTDWEQRWRGLAATLPETGITFVFDRFVLMPSGTLLVLFTPKGFSMEELRFASKEAFPGHPPRQANICHGSMARITIAPNFSAQQVASIDRVIKAESERLRGSSITCKSIWFVKKFNEVTPISWDLLQQLKEDDERVSNFKRKMVNALEKANTGKAHCFIPLGPAATIPE